MLSTPRTLLVVFAGAVTLGSTAGAQTAPTDSGRSSVVRGTEDDAAGTMRLGVAEEARVTLGGYLQVDGRMVSGATVVRPDGIVLRRARLIVDVAASKGWHLRLQPDFGQGRVLIQDAFIGFTDARREVRVGRFRPAFGVERAQSSSTLLFAERGIVNSLMPSRALGAQVTVIRGPFALSLGGFHTPIGTDLPPVDTDGDVDAVAGAGHDLLARAVWRVRRPGHWADLQAGILDGRERGSPDEPALARLLSVAQQPLFSFENDGTTAASAFAAGDRRRLSAGGVVGNGRSVAALEWASLRQTVRWAAVDSPLTTEAATARVARVWRGLRNAAHEIRPLTPGGAWEIGLRAGAARLHGPRIDAIALDGSVRRARTAGVALGWIPTTLRRVVVSYDWTDGRTPGRAQEHALTVRMQQGF